MQLRPGSGRGGGAEDQRGKGMRNGRFIGILLLGLAGMCCHRELRQKASAGEEEKRDKLREISERFKRMTKVQNKVDEGLYLFEVIHGDMNEEEIVSLLGEPEEVSQSKTRRKKERKVWFYNLFWSCYLQIDFENGRISRKIIAYNKGPGFKEVRYKQPAQKK
ncbi:MAG: hypothetical protein ACYTHM_17165 [Planctomycetota bacterium]|jgi:hypothetical protein